MLSDTASYMVITKNPWADFDDSKKIKGLLTKYLDQFDYKNSINFLRMR